MNPLFQWIASLATRKALSRTCPYCGFTNTVPREFLKTSILCGHCTREIPPPG